MSRSHPDVAERYYPHLFRRYFPEGLPRTGIAYWLLLDSSTAAELVVHGTNAWFIICCIYIIVVDVRVRRRGRACSSVSSTRITISVDVVSHTLLHFRRLTACRLLAEHVSSDFFKNPHGSHLFSSDFTHWADLVKKNHVELKIGREGGSPWHILA